jgi:hypothetical protein
VKSKSHLTINLEKYSQKILSAKIQTARNANKAIGKRYSTISQSHGINTAQSINITFIVIARVSGIAISVTSAFDDFKSV